MISMTSMSHDFYFIFEIWIKSEKNSHHILKYALNVYLGGYHDIEHHGANNLLCHSKIRKLAFHGNNPKSK